MPLYKLTDQQLNYFKYATVVLDEFPKALRETFKSMWDSRYSVPPTNQLWDDTNAVRSQLRSQEGGDKCKIPTDLSYDLWDCTALFKATIYAHSFKGRDAHGCMKTLSDLYVEPLHLESGDFHTTLESQTGCQEETIALAIDQLRRLRNHAFHQSSSHDIDKATFDQRMKLAQDAFTALGSSTATIDNIKGLKEEHFPTDQSHGLLVRLLDQATSMLNLQEKVESLKVPQLERPEGNSSNDGEVTENELDEISQCTTGNVTRLGIKLGLSSDKIDTFNHLPTPSKKAFQMLKYWKGITKTHLQRESLAVALQNIGRYDLAGKLRRKELTTTY